MMQLWQSELLFSGDTVEKHWSLQGSIATMSRRAIQLFYVSYVICSQVIYRAYSMQWVLLERTKSTFQMVRFSP